MSITTWEREIYKEMSRHGEAFGDVVFTTLTGEEMHKEFNSGFGWSEGEDFTLWTKNRVYFPITYDGAEWVGSVPRNPCDEKSPHMGDE